MFKFTEKNLKKVNEAVKKYPSGRAQSAVMEVLYIAQEQNGWISNDVMKEVASLLDMPKTKVKEIATFYTMYYKEPVGKFVFQVCGTTPCMLRGSQDIIKAIQNELKIKIGETTQNGLFTLLEVECLGACSNAPMIQVNDDYYEDLSPDAVIKIIQEIKAGSLPAKGSVIGRKSAEPFHLAKKSK